MKRVLTSIGIGSATVDTILPDTAFSPGETIRGTVELTGGDSTQEIDGVYFALKARHTADGGERDLGTFTVDEHVALSADEERSLPVEFELPVWTPLTQGGASVWLETGVDIAWAVDPTDEDQIDIVPDESLTALFDAIDALGFALEGSRLVDVAFVDGRPFAQKFDFRPTDRFTDDLADLEVTILPRESDLRVLLEFDHYDEVEAEYDLDLAEQEVSLTFEHANTEMMQNRILREIKEYT